LTGKTPRLLILTNGTVPSHTIQKLIFKHALMHFCVRINKSHIINTVQKKNIFKRNKDQKGKYVHLNTVTVAIAKNVASTYYCGDILRRTV